MRIFALLAVLLVIFSCQSFSQGGLTKEMLVEMAKSGVFDKMSPADIRQKLKDAGITEEEAIRYARDRNIDFTKYLSPGAMAIDTTAGGQAVSTQVTPIINVAAPNLSAPGGPTTILPIDTSSKIAPDMKLVPKGRYNLDYFGYNLFKKLPTAFEPNSVGQVDQGYVIGPGDDILISVWGHTEFQYQL
jgi:polysaccharide biosynthesis/export protein